MDEKKGLLDSEATHAARQKKGEDVTKKVQVALATGVKEEMELSMGQCVEDQEPSR